MRIHLVTAEHFSVPGLITKAFMTEDAAMAEAADLVNIMLKDDGQQPDATAEQWGLHLELLQDKHGAQYCYVEIIGLDVAGSDSIDAMRYRLAEAVSATPGFDDPDEPVNGSDLVEWFGEWRGRVKKLLDKVEG